jgi:hypothetical protein
MTDAGNPAVNSQVDAAMQGWRQGDVAQVQNFVHLADGDSKRLLLAATSASLFLMILPVQWIDLETR